MPLLPAQAKIQWRRPKVLRTHHHRESKLASHARAFRLRRRNTGRTDSRSYEIGRIGPGRLLEQSLPTQSRQSPKSKERAGQHISCITLTSRHFLSFSTTKSTKSHSPEPKQNPPIITQTRNKIVKIHNFKLFRTFLRTLFRGTN